jgi:hypothetical protein
LRFTLSFWQVSNRKQIVVAFAHQELDGTPFHVHASGPVLQLVRSGDLKTTLVGYLSGVSIKADKFPRVAKAHVVGSGPANPKLPTNRVHTCMVIVVFTPE